MEKKFSKIEIAVIKRTAQNVAQFTNKKEKLDAKIAELEAEKAALQPMIDSFQGPIKDLTGGFTTEDLVKKEVIHTGKIDTKTGKEILQVRYSLIYPETVVPPTDSCSEDCANDCGASEAPISEEAENVPTDEERAEEEATNAVDPFNEWN